jgi:hypothetical protein
LVWFCFVLYAHFQAGIILCCLGLAIFGITEVPTEGVEFDTSDFVVEGSTESLEGGGVTTVEPPVRNYVAPSAATESVGVDPADLSIGSPSSEPPRIPPKVSVESSLRSPRTPDTSTITKHQQQQPLPAEFYELD